mgnify:CR=1 FL=1
MLKVLELNPTRAGFQVGPFAVQSLPNNAVVERGISDHEAVISNLKLALEQAGAQSRNAVVAIASSHVVSRSFSVPRDFSSEELEDYINQEAKTVVQFPITEARIDFVKLGVSTNNPDEDLVIFYACRKEIIDDYEYVLDRSGLRTAIVDIDTLALQRGFSLVLTALGDTKQDQTIGLIDYGEFGMRLYVIVDGRLVYSRDHAFGGRNLTDSIIEHYGVSIPEAIDLKVTATPPEDYEGLLLDPFKDAMIRETSRALEFFASSSRSYEGIDLVFLTGGCACIEGIARNIAEEIGIPTMIANPFPEHSYKGKVHSASKNASLLLTACGLAMRSYVK